jgi:hypothetical protein
MFVTGVVVSVIVVQVGEECASEGEKDEEEGGGFLGGDEFAGGEERGDTVDIGLVLAGDGVGRRKLDDVRDGGIFEDEGEDSAKDFDSGGDQVFTFSGSDSGMEYVIGSECDGFVERGSGGGG